jgi:hypothetical protein
VHRRATGTGIGTLRGVLAVPSLCRDTLRKLVSRAYWRRKLGAIARRADSGR